MPRARRLCYVNAGHCPGLLVGERDHGIAIARLDVGGPVLGILEATNPAGEEYGESRLGECLATVGAGRPEEVRAAILASASAFLGPAPPRDDATLVVATSA